MKKRTLIISLSIIALIAVAIVVVCTKNHKEDTNFDDMVERFESAAEEVLGDDVKKVSMTELAATITYGNGNDEDNIYYRILKTTYYEGGDPSP